MSTTAAGIVQLLVPVALLAFVHRPLGDFMARVFTGSKHLGVERAFYRVVRVDPQADQRWSMYVISLLGFSAVSVLFLFGFQRLQSYLPLSLDFQLLARLRAAIRRVGPAEEEAVVVAGELTVDVARKKVTRAGSDVRLTPTEWQLLEVLVRARGKLVDRKQLLHEVWGPAYNSETNYLRVYTAQLRRKLEQNPSRPVHIITEPGMGYRFEP
jgi:DNA-binding winged helix-turn-helix (wHTH) protein